MRRRSPGRGTPERLPGEPVGHPRRVRFPAVRPDVEVVGHRGASADAPEHTLAAYQHALRIGADAVECDVRMTRDGVLVCVHDRRINRTSTGRGVVSTLTLAELEQHSFGARVPRSTPWRSASGRPLPRPRKKAPVPRISPGHRIPEDEPDRSEQGILTLHALLDYVTSTPGDVRLAIETKHPTRHSARVERALLDDLRRFGLLRGGRPVERGGLPGVRMMSFSTTAVRRVQTMAPELPTVQLLQRMPTSSARALLLRPATAIGPGVAMLRRHPELVKQAHAAGTDVHVWVVNEPEDVDFVLNLGVDAVITDRPGALLDRLGRGAAAS